MRIEVVNGDKHYHAWIFGQKELMKDIVSMNAEGFI